MPPIEPVYVGNDAVNELLQYCKANNLNRFTVIADNNTYPALGEKVDKALNDAGYEVKTIVLQGDEIIADTEYLVHVLIEALQGDCTFIAVGSGTITDITRFTSHRSGRKFISMPTAPSVDGFTSQGAPLVLRGVKQTIICHAPVAVFADLDVMSKSPQRLVAAGYGDMIGKINSLADWSLGALLWEEPFDESIYKRSEGAIEACLTNSEKIGQRTPEGVKLLMDSLVESGFCMLEFGTSRPASGAEHHASHYWEMQLLLQKRPAILHGAKVGFALIGTARQYAKIREISREQMMERLEAATLPDREAEVATINEAYGPVAETVINTHGAFLDMTEEKFDQVKQRIADNWDKIQEIAEKVPSPEKITEYLEQVGAPTTPQTLGLGEEEIKPGFEYGHYLRNRFTVMKLSRILDVELG